jgi:hypothetical protein
MLGVGTDQGCVTVGELVGDPAAAGHGGFRQRTSRTETLNLSRFGPARRMPHFRVGFPVLFKAGFDGRGRRRSIGRNWGLVCGQKADATRKCPSSSRLGCCAAACSQSA